MKDYMSSVEREKFILIVKACNILEDMVGWEKRGTISKEDRKNIKHSITLLQKTFGAMIDRLNPQAKTTMKNSLKSSYAVLTNEFGIQQYLKKKSADEKVAFEENKEFYDLVEEIMMQNCDGCKKHCTDCKYYEIFERNYIGDMEFNLPNCKYAYCLKKEKIEK